MKWKAFSLTEWEGKDQEPSSDNMINGALKITLLSVLVVAGAIGVYLYDRHISPQKEIAKLQAEKQELQQIVQRLSTEQRRAEVLVTDQKTIDGELHTTLLFVEYAKDGTTLPPKSFTIRGNTAHIDALVIKIQQDFVQKNDPLRGHSIVLFHRLFGEHQPPVNGYPIDEPGKIPDIYRGVDPKVSEFEQQLWKNFWRLTEDESYREQMGVRVAHRESPWSPFEPNRLYRLTIESDGGINLISEPVPGIYQQLIKNGENAGL